MIVVLLSERVQLEEFDMAAVPRIGEQIMCTMRGEHLELRVIAVGHDVGAKTSITWVRVKPEEEYLAAFDRVERWFFKNGVEAQANAACNRATYGMDIDDEQEAQ